MHADKNILLLMDVYEFGERKSCVEEIIQSVV